MVEESGIFFAFEASSERNTAMKKRLSLFLALAMLLLAAAGLSACGHKHTFDEGAFTLPTASITGVEKISTCTGCGETKTETVPFGETTAETWRRMLAPTNYSVDISSVDLTKEASYIVTEDGYLAKETLKGFEQYILKEDDGWYSVALVDGEYKSHKIAIEPDLSLGALIMPGMDEAFDGFPSNENWTFTYDEEWSAYVHTRETNKYFFFVADDILVKIIGFGASDVDKLASVTPESGPSDDYSLFIFDFHSYGTTKLERPDYE